MFTSHFGRFSHATKKRRVHQIRTVIFRGSSGRPWRSLETKSYYLDPLPNESLPPQITVWSQTVRCTTMVIFKKPEKAIPPRGHNRPLRIWVWTSIAISSNWVVTTWNKMAAKQLSPQVPFHHGTVFYSSTTPYWPLASNIHGLPPGIQTTLSTGSAQYRATYVCEYVTAYASVVCMSVLRLKEGCTGSSGTLLLCDQRKPTTVHNSTI